MRVGKRYWYYILPIIILAGIYFVWNERSTTLEFRELSSPAGFRELVLDNEFSGIDPFIGLERKSKSVRPAHSLQNICDALFRDPTSPTAGNVDAKISIVEFSDYRCPYCKQLTVKLKEIQTADSRVRIVYKEWPILGESSEMAARAALAAGKQGKYHEFHAKLMRSGFVPTIGYVEELARNLELDLSLMRKDMASREMTYTIQRNADLATELGFKGTPSLVVGRTVVQGAVSAGQLKSLLEFEISSKGSSPCYMKER